MRRPSARAPLPPAPAPRAWLLALGALLAIFGAHAGRYWDFTVDDAGISFAYARNLADGHGLVLTPGAERVEGATNLLFVLMLAPAKWLGVGHETFAKLLGLAGASVALACIGLFPSFAYRRAPRWFDLLAPSMAALMPHFALWTVSGLENGVFAAFAAASLLALAWEEHDERRFPWSAPLLVALFMTRPDGALYVGVVGAAKLLRSVAPRPRGQDLRWVFTLGLGVGCIELFRLAYFAWPFPNSFYTKKRTFDFGKQLFDPSNPGIPYVLGWVNEYKLHRVFEVIPFALLGFRAPAARFALFGAVTAGVFFPVYSHGDWMEEWRFLSFVAPLVCLGAAEGVRSLVRIAQAPLPRAARPAFALVLGLVGAAWLFKEGTRHYPARWRAVGAPHPTLEMGFVSRRAAYFVAAGRALELDRRPSLLDPDVGGSSYDGRLAIVDLFGLGDVSIAHQHPHNPPGTRAAIFQERRPDFIHLHGAWFAAMELQRLEEVEPGYLRLNNSLRTGESDPDVNYVRREALAAPWYLPSELRTPEGITAEAHYPHPQGFTVSHRALEPGVALFVDLTLAAADAGAPGTVAVEPEGGGALQQQIITIGNGAVDPSQFWRGERPRVRARFPLAPGRYRVVFRSVTGETGVLAPSIVVAPGAGRAESQALRGQMTAALRDGAMGDAWRIARMLGVRVVADPRDAPALEALGAFGMSLAERARSYATAGAPRIAAELAREARAWAAHDPRVISRTESVAEQLADEARTLERQGYLTAARDLARDAVRTDPRRSWARRRVEELRDRVAEDWDGGRDVTAYRFAAMAVNGEAPVDDALVFLGSVGRYVEAARVAARLAHTPRDPMARVVVARGRVTQGFVREALELVAGVPCAEAHDVELFRALRSAFGRPYRPEPACEQVAPARARTAPFDEASGSFEQGTFAGWSTEGDAFGTGPVHGQAKHQQWVGGWHGHSFASSFARDSDSSMGVLRSRPFVVRDAGMSFLVGGGSNVALEGVRLVVDGVPVLSAAGGDHEGLRRAFWDLRPLRGRTATLEIYDQNDGSWGHVSADDFRAEPVSLPGSLSSTPQGVPPAPAQ